MCNNPAALTTLANRFTMPEPPLTTRLCALADRLSGATGFVGACLVLPLAAVMFYEVVLRFCFNLPTFWAYEFAWMLTGAHFALGIGYVLREDQHVRVDFLYARFGPRGRAAVNLFSQALFIAPLAVWLGIHLGGEAVEAWQVGEVSGESAWNPVVWPLKTAVFAGFAVFAVQVIATMARDASVLLGRDPGIGS